MIKFTIWDLVIFFSYEALLYLAIPIVLIAAVLLAVPALRRHRILRNTAYGLSALLVLLVLAASPMLGELWQEHEDHLAFAAATHHLATPQTIDGIAFPAGSTVHVNPDGHPAFGTLAAPTMIDGVPLIGAFELAGEQGNRDIDGTLAGPVEVHGIPCGAGKFKSESDATTCVLANDYTFSGYILASHRAVGIFRSPLNEPPVLRFGTLARPEMLFDVTWPAGTILGRINAPPSRMAHGPGPDNQEPEFCVPAGQMVALDGVTLHGFLAYSVEGDRRLISSVCSILPDEPVGDDGYVEVGTQRYQEGERPNASAAWQWTEPLQITGR